MGRETRQNARGELGITMLEFTFAIVIVILVVGAFFDIGLGLHQYSLINHTTEKAARETAALLATRPTCAVIETYLRDVASHEMQAGGSNGSLARWTYSTTPAQRLTLTGTMPLNCFFICSILGHSWQTSSSATVFLDSPRAPTNCAGQAP